MGTERRQELPPEYLRRIQSLEAAYLRSMDPIVQSGFSGGRERWRREREPILDAIGGDGDILDVGCANGYLLHCLVRWGLERGFRLVPHGVDMGPRLIEQARLWHPEFAENFYVANAWDWRPPRRFRYVYTLHDCVPEDMLEPYVRRLLDRAVEPGGRLIVGAYGSASEGTPPRPVGDVLRSYGFAVAGESAGGEPGRPPVTRFAWIDREGGTE
jgi:SAM-dependent methyltransferase